jgi:hypothetical protein
VAEKLSRIVVNDSHFGFIALSNSPPIGKATVADDGEPCPISGINNLLATIRLDTLMAHELNDSNLCQLADADYEQAIPKSRPDFTTWTAILLHHALTPKICFRPVLGAATALALSR